MRGFFFCELSLGCVMEEKNAWDKIILGLKNSRGIGQVSVQFSKWHAILSRSNSWQCNWLECALLHKGPLLPSVPFENSKKKRNSQNVVLVFVPKTFSTLDHYQSIWFKDISTLDFSTPRFNPGPFNLRLFNHELFNHELFNHELFNPRLFNHEFLNNWVEKFMVEKYMVEKSGIE